VTKYEIFKIQDGGWPPYCKSILAIFQQQIARLSVKFCVKMQFPQNVSSKWDRHRRSTERISVPQYVLFCFRNAVCTAASGGFSYRLRYTCHLTSLVTASSAHSWFQRESWLIFYMQYDAYDHIQQWIWSANFLLEEERQLVMAQVDCTVCC